MNTATPRQKGALLLFLIPMFAILSPLLGGMTIAIDSTAGERERGSLEPLLANPVPICAGGDRQVARGVDLRLGRGDAHARRASCSRRSLYAGKRLAAFMTFGAPEFVQFVAIVVPFAAMTSALQMLICTYGRSYREAQTYVSYLATVVSFVPLVVHLLRAEGCVLAAHRCRCSGQQVVLVAHRARRRARRSPTGCCPSRGGARCVARPVCVAMRLAPAARRAHRLRPRRLTASADRSKRSRTADLAAVFAAAARCRARGARLPATAPQQVEFAQRGAGGDRVGGRADRRGRHRHRQDLRLPRAGAARGRAA